MSLESWKEDFYPVEANDVPPGKPSIEHSLVKWVGLREENLNKHNIIFDDDDGNIGGDGDGSLSISGESCALCCNYLADGCRGCPLFISLGGRVCDDSGKAKDSPFGRYFEEHTPEPMIQALELALKNFEEE
jgi:hypothetical protein